MTRLKLIIITLAFTLAVALVACAPLTGPGSDATARILGRRIGYQGTRLYTRDFIPLGITANQACPQRVKMAVPADVAFSLIIKTIHEKTGDPSLTQDLNDVLQIMGIELSTHLQVINLTPEIRGLILQFVCSFAQGVDQAKRNL